jgi:hypothetical protein
MSATGMGGGFTLWFGPKTMEGLGVRFIMEIERFKRLLTRVQNIMANFSDESPRSGASGIFPCDLNVPLCLVGYIEPPQIDLIQKYVGPQLPLRGILSASYQGPSGPPESNRSEEQQSGEHGNECVRDLEPIAKNRTPELGSLIFAVLCLGLAFLAAAFASDAWGSGRCGVGCLMFCVVALMGLQSLLLGLDGWSIWRIF